MFESEKKDSQPQSVKRYFPLKVQRKGLFLRLTVWILVVIFLLAEIIILKYLSKIKVLDARLIYSPCEAIALVKSLDNSAILSYRVFNIFDFGLIILYSVLLVAWFRLLEPDAGMKQLGWIWLGLLPGMFDLIENIGVFILLSVKQRVEGIGAWLAAIGTPLKWLCASVVLFLILFAEIRGLQKRRREGRPWYDISSRSS